MADDEDQKRPWREQYETVGRTVIPLWFAVTGIALGVGGVVRDQPIAGACGAVAGVTVGWLQQQRASVYRRHNAALRRRLKKVRAEAQEQTEQLEHQVTALQAEVLEQKLMRMLMNPNPESVAELTGAIPVPAKAAEPAESPDSDGAAGEVEAPAAEPATAPAVTEGEPVTATSAPEETAEAEKPVAATPEEAAEIPAPSTSPADTTVAPAAEGETSDAGPDVADDEVPEVVAEDSVAEDSVAEDDDEPTGDEETDGAPAADDAPKGFGAQIIDLPAKLRAKAKRPAAQAG